MGISTDVNAKQPRVDEGRKCLTIIAINNARRVPYVEWGGGRTYYVTPDLSFGQEGGGARRAKIINEMRKTYIEKLESRSARRWLVAWDDVF